MEGLQWSVPTIGRASSPPTMLDHCYVVPHTKSMPRGEAVAFARACVSCCEQYGRSLCYD